MSNFRASAQDTQLMNSQGNLTIDGIGCDRMEHTTFHIHTLLIIYVDNKSYPIPMDTGILYPHCLYWLHTHDKTGLIHVESPVTREFTLGQFLNIWDKFDNSTIVHNIARNNLIGTTDVYINGTKLNENKDYRTITLKDREVISMRISK